MTCQKEYRDVYLITVLGEHFALGHFGGPGVKMTPQITCGRALSNEITGTVGVTENLVQNFHYKNQTKCRQRLYTDCLHFSARADICRVTVMDLIPLRIPAVIIIHAALPEIFPQVLRKPDIFSR